MTELTLQPYAARLRWQAAPGDPLPDWPRTLASFLEGIAQAVQQCASAGKRCVIGHIKGLSLAPDGGYWRGSVVAAGLPATIEAVRPPAGSERELTLNVLVYGLSYQQIDELVRQAADGLAAGRGLRFELFAAPRSTSGAYLHDHLGESV